MGPVNPLRSVVRSFGLGALGALLVIAPGCRTSCSYSTSDVAQRDWGRTNPAFVEPLYTAAPRAPVVKGQSRAEDWKELGASLSQHLGAAGLRATSATPPRTQADAERALEAARAKGEPLVFVTLNLIGAGGNFHDSIGLLYVIGLVPGLIGFALPIHDEFGMAQVCALVVDPQREERLGVYWGQANLNRTATGYGYDPAALSILAVKEATEELLGELAQAAKAGFPERTAEHDGLAALLVQHAATGLKPYGDKNPVAVLDTGAGGAAPAPAPATPPPGPAASPDGTNTEQFLAHWKELVEGETTLDETLALLGSPSVDQMRDGRRFLFWAHAEADEDGKIVTRMLSVWFREGVIDQVEFSST